MFFNDSTTDGLLGRVWGRVRVLARQLESSTAAGGDRRTSADLAGRIVGETQRRGGREYRYAYLVRASGSRRSLGVWGGAEHLAAAHQLEKAALRSRLAALEVKISALRAEHLALEAEVQGHIRAERSPNKKAPSR